MSASFQKNTPSTTSGVRMQRLQERHLLQVNPSFAYFSEGSLPLWRDHVPHAWKVSLEALDRLLRGLIRVDHDTDACRDCKLASLRQERAEIHRTREAAAILGIEIPQYKGNAHVWTTRITLLLLHLRREGIPCESEPSDGMLAIIESEIEATLREIEEFGEITSFNDMKVFPARSSTSFEFSGTYAYFQRYESAFVHPLNRK